MARALAAAEKFLAIELHPAVYVSFFAINLCLLFAYREYSGANAEDRHHTVASVTASAPVKADQSVQILALNEASISQSALPSAFHRHKVEKQVAESDDTTPAPVRKAVLPTPIAIESSGAVLAAVTEKPAKTKKKSRRKSYSNGLVPPPPPGVDVVPPPPDAPSLFIGGIKGGMNSFLVPPPPPMMLASSESSFDFSQVPSSSSGRRSHKSSRPGNDRARTVTHGNFKRIIVSR